MILLFQNNILLIFNISPFSFISVLQRYVIQNYISLCRNEFDANDCSFFFVLELDSGRISKPKNYFCQMELFRPYFSFNKAFVKSKSIAYKDGILIHSLLVRSRRLKRRVKVDIYLPMPFNPGAEIYPTLLLNDGQDSQQLDLAKSLRKHHLLSEKLVVVAVHAGDRINEYGTSGIPDYQHRGWKARTYSDFVVHRLIPYLQKHYQLFMNQETSYTGGFSLGGLSAMDMMWRYPNVFSKTGVFSGSFWWRHEPPTDLALDDHRIMH